MGAGKSTVGRRLPSGSACRSSIATARSRMPRAAPRRPKCSNSMARKIFATASAGWSRGWSTASGGSSPPAAGRSSIPRLAPCSSSARSPCGSTRRSPCWPSAPGGATRGRCCAAATAAGRCARLDQERRPDYAEADIHVRSGDGDHGDVVDAIVAALRGATRAGPGGMTRIEVVAGAARYDVLGRPARSCAERFADADSILVSEPHVFALHGDRAPRRVWASRRRSSFLQGEAAKQWDVLHMLSAACRAPAERSANIVAFGGGAVGDVAGLAASLSSAAADIVHVPTTLLRAGRQRGRRQDRDRRVRGEERHRQLPPAGAGAGRPGVARHARPAPIALGLCRDRQIWPDRRSGLLRLVPRQWRGAAGRRPALRQTRLPPRYARRRAMIAATSRTARASAPCSISATPLPMPSKQRRARPSASRRGGGGRHGPRAAFLARRSATAPPRRRAPRRPPRRRRATDAAGRGRRRRAACSTG